uniref:Uncharacterized protein n=1 Tax=Chrysotila carterae TaxID=13221 RepID=A0A7S4BZY5_CHRCT|mmetsp:Transcript_48355/g.104760  ORF Transcript_48355/g.104760 Transcript_48355/m.104760 type:complete len:138 (-) Transcript_48355:334-747(-)|eukprot:3568601-Pleurochrysis_carterae.AAC.5
MSSKKGNAAPLLQSHQGPYWFTVKYGEDETQLFNMDCWSVVLCDHIKERCGFADMPEQIDLQREDKSVVGLAQLGKQYASLVLAPKAKYSLCKLVKEADGSPPSVESLWTPPEPVQEVQPVVPVKASKPGSATRRPK